MFCILGYGATLFTKPNRFLNYASPASMPVYVLHQTVIVVFGYFIIGWTINPLIQYLILLLASSVAILALYESFIRRFNPVRFLFGMKMKRRAG